MKLYIYLLFTFLLIANYNLLPQSGWFQQNSGVFSPLRCVYFTDQNNGTVVGDVGKILRTTDGGVTWAPQTSGTLKSLSSVVFTDINKGIAVGGESSENIILRTTNGGNTWIQQTIPYNYVLSDISFVDSDNGFVVGASIYTGGIILRTTDGGNSWTMQVMTSMRLIGVSFVDVNNGTAVGYSGTILRTTDGGNTWNAQSSGTTIFLYDVFAIDQNNCIAVGRDGVIVKTTDGGTNWTLVLSGTSNWLNSIYFTNQNTGWIVGNGGTILKTIDGGNTWKPQSGWTNMSLFEVNFINAKIGTAVGESGTIMRTLNGGIPVELTSFTAKSMVGKIQLNWITASELNNLGFEIERKTDSDEWRIIGFKEGRGTTIEKQNYQYVDNIGDIKTTSFCYRLKQIDFDGSFEYSDEILVEYTAPLDYSLQQNYPNPFNPITTIKYQIPELSSVTLKVYDVLGSEVATLINEEKPSGSYEVDFDASTLPSGIYFYRLQTGSFVETKKMVLMK